ncbi:MAG: LysM peptidoglycan-binding domain-containing protein [Planctomycetota bacterium]|nr:LysM peptidoglycan-binding domain-containing protein [Planctomycetota bacterium]
MTRETKIGLLVGLAFIIVIGILLSDHFQKMEPEAAITGVASTVRAGVNSPGTSNPPIVVVAPADAPPRQPVPTHEELNPPAAPVVPSAPVIVPQTVATNNIPSSANSPAMIGIAPSPAAPQASEAPIAVAPVAKAPIQTNDLLAQEARRHGEELVPLNPDGSPAQDDATTVQVPGRSKAVTTAKMYKVQPGDTVSKLAGRYLGGNTRANRQAIIDANPSLKSDPDKVIVGQTYVIPSVAVPVTPSQVVAVPPTPDAPASVDSPKPAPSSQYIYTAAAGDSLWRIANDELGDPTAVDAIKELNLGVLKGKNHDVVIAGTKLRLPAKPLASAN